MKHLRKGSLLSSLTIAGGYVVAGSQLFAVDLRSGTSTRLNTPSDD